MTPPSPLPALFCIACILLAAGCIDTTGTEKAMVTPLPQTSKAVSQQVGSVQPVQVQPAVTNSISTIPPEFPAAGNDTPRVARGDRYHITGNVLGEPVPQVIIWIFGKKYIQSAFVPVEQNGSFLYEIRQVDTQNMENGTHLIVIQHPGSNGKFDILPENNMGTNATARSYHNTGFLKNGTSAGRWEMIPCGDGSRGICFAGYPASADLIAALKDPTIDDRFTTSQIIVEEPWIRVDPVNVKRGENFTMTGTTNLAAGDELLVQVYPKWFVPTQCGCGALSPYLQMMLDKSGIATGTIKVSKGSGRINTWAFDGEGETLGPDEFKLNVYAVIQRAENETSFRVT